jgi:hypothetical protein
MTDSAADRGLRPARMPMCSMIMLSCGGDSWFAQVEDISASGARVRRPRSWRSEVGDLLVADMLVGDDFDLHFEARVARLTAEYIGLAFARIPADKEIPLWNLLGGYADRLESFEVDSADA